MATGEAELYSGMDEVENHERGVGLILSRDAAKVENVWVKWKGCAHVYSTAQK